METSPLPVGLAEFETTLRTLAPDSLKNHTLDGLPTLHQLAKHPFVEPEDVVILDKIIKLLVDSGYDINQITDHYLAKKRASLGFTALLAAVERSNIPLVECLIRNGARTDIRDSRGYSPLHWTVIIGDQKCLEKLIESGAQVTSREQDQSGDIHPILHTAVDEGRSGMVFYLVEKGLVDPNETSIYRRSLSKRPRTSFPSKFNRSQGIVKTGDMRFTPLARAVRMRKIPLIMFLVNRPDVKLQGFSELHFCIVEGDTEVARLLKACFSDEERANDKIDQKWALHCLHPSAFQDPNRVVSTQDLIQDYIDAGWNPNSVSTVMVTRPIPIPIDFFDAPLTGPYIQMNFLLTNYNILHMACLSANGETINIIKFLVKEGVDINAKTGGGSGTGTQLTPLQILLLLEQWESALYLIEKGADLHAVGVLSGVQFTRFCRKTAPVAGVRVEDSYCRFNSVELLLRLGHESTLPVFLKMLEKGVRWNFANELHLAIEGLNLNFISQVLKEHSQPGSFSTNNLTWITQCKSREEHPLKLEKVPSLLWLLKTLRMKPSKVKDVDVLADIMRHMVTNHGYDCNLMESTEEGNDVDDLSQESSERSVNSSFDPRPLIYYALDIDFSKKSNSLLTTLLKFPHVNLNVPDIEWKNPVELVINNWHKLCSTGVTNCWNADDGGRTCFQAVKLLVNHGVNVGGLVIGRDVQKYHAGYLPLIKFLYSVGAKIHPKFFEPSQVVCNFGNPGTKKFQNELEELKDWKNKFDERTCNGINLQIICRETIRSTWKKVGDMHKLDRELPQEVRESLLGKIINF